MSPENTCPQCQTPLPPDAPVGLCPRCLIRSAAGLGEKPAGVPEVDFPDIGDPADVARRLPQFEIIELLGKGGMGVVYKARQVELDRLVALKILPPADALSPDFVERFRREARALAKLNHPNIVGVHEFGAQGGLHYFVMEFVDGANLRMLLQTKRLTPAEALGIVPQICDALEFAHGEGIVHRDIKPENILLDKKGRLKIADFGLAKLLRRESFDVTLTASGTSLGTLRYMAPEQMEKPEAVDHRADIYSLGVVLYEMLTGEVPMGRFAPPSERAQVDVKLDEIVLRSLERDVERRYQHASEVKQDVQSVTGKPQVAPTATLAATTPATPPASAGEGVPSATSKPPKRHLLSAFLVLLTLVAFFFGFSFQAKSTAGAGGPTKTVTVGALDPLYVSKTGPSGFQTGLHLISWSFFAVVVAIIGFSALWRIGREDQGEVPRDPAWWRNWSKAVGVWGGLLLAACVVRTMMNPERVLAPPGNHLMDSRFPKPADRKSKAVPPLGPITNGIGAEFAVPPGQVAVFEIVTPRDGKIVPVPPHCAYVLAPAGDSIQGTFRWSREPARESSSGRRWRIDVASGAGNGTTGGLLLADDLDAAVGATGLTLGSLEPNEETVHGNGPVRLRITTVAHNLKTSASGIGHTDWKKPKETNATAGGALDGR